MCTEKGDHHIAVCCGDDEMTARRQTKYLVPEFVRLKMTGNVDYVGAVTCIEEVR